MKTLLSGAAAGLLLAINACSAEIWQTLPQPPPMPQPRESGMAPVIDIQMYYAVYGDGPPVLLIHGGLGHADNWALQITALAENHKVIVADSRGHGRSTRSSQPFSYALMADDYRALLDFLKIDKVALVGWSDGGIIGLDIAIRHPERLSRLFAFAANFTTAGTLDVSTSPTFKAYLVRARKDYARLSPKPGEFDAFVSQISRMWTSEPKYSEDQLRAITVPTTIFVGEHDEAIKPEHTREMAELIPGAGLVIMKGASHFAMWQKPGEFNALVREFLAGRPGRCPRDGQELRTDTCDQPTGTTTNPMPACVPEMQVCPRIRSCNGSCDPRTSRRRRCSRQCGPFCR